MKDRDVNIMEICRQEREKRMNIFLVMENFKCVYCSERPTEQKVKEIMELHPELATYRDDLEKLFDCPAEELPIIKGVEITTNKIGGDTVHGGVTVTKLPSQVSPEIQKTIMRIAGCLGGFQCRKWGCSDWTDNGRKYFREYFDSRPELTMELLKQINQGKHKVLETEYDEIEGRESAGYCIREITGILLD